MHKISPTLISHLLQFVCKSSGETNSSATIIVVLILLCRMNQLIDLKPGHVLRIKFQHDH